MQSKAFHLSIVSILVLILPACSTKPTPLATEEATFVAADGVADGEMFVWLDENANGIVDEGEKPLSNIPVGIGYPSVRTGEDGKAAVAEFMPGCSDECWKGGYAVVDVPEGYKPTTPTEVPLTGYGQEYQFGLVADLSTTTATP